MLGGCGSAIAAAAVLLFGGAAAAAGSDVILAGFGLNGRKLFYCGCQLIGRRKHHKYDLFHPLPPYTPLHSPTFTYITLPKKFPLSPSKPLILSNIPKIFNIYLKFFQKYLVD